MQPPEPRRPPVYADRSPTPLAPVAVLIPAWEPPPVLISLVQAVLRGGVGCVVVVDDGSVEEHRPTWLALAETPRVAVLHHDTNCGKGAALKTGIHHILQAMPWCSTLVTMDADGQHRPEDALRVAHTALEAPGTAVLGARTLPRSAPWRSRFGNTLTRSLFHMLTGRNLIDTQTGLRAFPRALLPELVNVPGERYEFEMRVLLELCRRRLPLIEVPVETVYLDGNRGSHFRPLRDSWRVGHALISARRQP